jgi:hypothetical protein
MGIQITTGALPHSYGGDDVDKAGPVLKAERKRYIVVASVTTVWWR